ncbi:MAG: acyl-CoA dehydrogenase family protein, partial [Deltaproteobacteria bacterium]
MRPRSCAARAGSRTTPGPPSTPAPSEDLMPDCYPQLTDTQRMVRDTIRRIVETELGPHVEAMEHGDALPYPYIRKLAAGLGMAGTGDLPAAMAAAAPEDRLDFLVPASVGIEIARVCGGVLVSYGVSYGQVAGTIRK